MAKRIYRNDMAQDQKDKIAAANVGKHLTQATKDKIAAAMAKYWASLPYKPGTDDAGRATALYTPTDKQIQAATGQEPTTLPPPPRKTGTTKQPTKQHPGRPGNTGNSGNTGITYY